MAYATVTQVQARNPYRTIGSSTSPSTSQVAEWIEEADADIDGILLMLGLTSPCVNANGVKVLRNRVVTYVSGLVAQAYAAAGGDGGNVDGEEAEVKWQTFLTDLVDNSVEWGGRLQGGSAGEGAVKARSHSTHNQDSLTVAADDFAPRFVKDSPEDQF